jgi:hypothetical protein
VQGAELDAWFVVDPGDRRLERGDHLGLVLGQGKDRGDDAEDAVAVQLQFTPVSLDQLGEGIRVTGLCSGDKISFDENPPIRVATAVSPVRLPV